MWEILTMSSWFSLRSRVVSCSKRVFASLSATLSSLKAAASLAAASLAAKIPARNEGDPLVFGASDCADPPPFRFNSNSNAHAAATAVASSRAVRSRSTSARNK